MEHAEGVQSHQPSQLCIGLCALSAKLECSGQQSSAARGVLVDSCQSSTSEAAESDSGGDSARHILHSKRHDQGFKRQCDDDDVRRSARANTGPAIGNHNFFPTPVAILLLYVKNFDSRTLLRFS